MTRLSKVAILGPGLLGGSIALALRRRAPGVDIGIWARRDEAVAEVQSLGIADVVSRALEPVVQAADLVIFCVPIGSMPALAENVAPLVSSANVIVTDVGSVKAPVVEMLSRIFQGRARFVGSHPMAGSEQAGLNAAREDLFENAICILTPDRSSDQSAVAKLHQFWEQLGCRVRTLPPQEHDEMIALVSHLPHLVAATLVHTAHTASPESLDLCGNGFRDTTRVASGPPAMWREIFEQNRESLKKSANAMVEKLRDVLKLLDSGDPQDSHTVEQFLTEAKTARDRLKIKLHQETQ